MTIAYRDAGPDDAALLPDLFRTCFTDTFAHLYQPGDLAAFLAGFGEATWRAELEQPDLKLRLAEEDGRTVGFAKIGDPTLPAKLRGPTVELRQLYILGPWHGRGVAAELMRWAIDEARARGAEDMILSVYVDNHRARRFYARYGFEVIGDYAFMVGNHADEDLIMRVRLEEIRDH
jgi:ribosomal protein S18 acetylase RimI-like enzyme